MIFDLLDHPNLRMKDRLMGLMYELGMGSIEDFATIMNRKESMVYKDIKMIRFEHGSTKEERDLWIKSYTLKNRKRMYVLGSEGIKYVRELLGFDNHSGRVITDSQIDHYRGINDVLIRLIKEIGINFKWHNSYEANDYLYRLVEGVALKQQKEMTIKRNKLIRPDARLVLGNITYFIEYDTGTERQPVIIDKYDKYMNTFRNINWFPPVVWVTTTKKRRDSLEKIWNYRWETRYKKRERKDQKKPEMYFFTPGQETTFLIEQYAVLGPKLGLK